MSNNCCIFAKWIGGISTPTDKGQAYRPFHFQMIGVIRIGKYYMEEKEVWRDVVGYEGLYQVSNIGRVKSLQRIIHLTNGKILTIKERIKNISCNNNGYLMATLCKGGICGKYLVHRLVAQAFIPNPQNKPDIDHIDTDKSNNIVGNLKWVTPKENSNNPKTRKSMSIMSVGKLLGQKSPFAKKVYRFSLDMKLIATYPSSTDAAKVTGLSRRKIQHCCHGEQVVYDGSLWALTPNYEFKKESQKQYLENYIKKINYGNNSSN